MNNQKVQKRIRRHLRIRAKVSGTAERPRLAVSKSNSNMIAQLINDDAGQTIGYVWTKNMAGKTLQERAIAAGKKIAEIASSKNITHVVFDRGGFLYTGNLKAFADAAREAGLTF